MDCMLFTLPCSMPQIDPSPQETSKDSNSALDTSLNASVDDAPPVVDKDECRPPLAFITCGQSLPPPLQWLEAEETSDDEDDGVLGFGFSNACTSLTWRKGPAIEESIEKESDNERATSKKANSPSCFESFWDNILNACGFRDSSPPQPCAGSYAWI
jgi:hypothetical protein